MASIILVHGAWHGGWCWERVVPLLEKKRHTVLAPDLPGRGEGRLSRTRVTLKRSARFVADLVRQQPEPVVLVGHSYGGIVISQTAEYTARHVRSLVYLAAFLVPNGETLWDMMQQTLRDSNRAPHIVMSPDRKLSTLVPHAVRDAFYNTTADEWSQRALSLVCPEPMAGFVEPLSLSENAFGSVPRNYIECLHDRVIPLALQRSMRAVLPCKRIVSLDADHSPFYSTPELLAGHLAALSETDSR